MTIKACLAGATGWAGSELARDCDVLIDFTHPAAARLVPHWEILDYAHDGKADAPSGTTRELAARLARVRAPAAARVRTWTVRCWRSVGSRAWSAWCEASIPSWSCDDR